MNVEARNERQYDDYLTGYIPHTLTTIPVSSLTSAWHEIPINLLPCYKGFILHNHAMLHYISPDGACTSLGVEMTYNASNIYFVAVYPNKTVVFLRTGSSSVNSNFVKLTVNFDDALNVTTDVVSYDELGIDGFPDYVKGELWSYDNHPYGWYSNGLLFTNKCRVLDAETFEEVGVFGTPSSSPTLNIYDGGRFIFFDKANKTSGIVTVDNSGIWNVKFGGATSFEEGAALSKSYVVLKSSYYRYCVGFGVDQGNGIVYGANDNFIIDPIIILPDDCFAAADGIYKAYSHGICGRVKIFNVGTVKANLRIQRDYVGNFAIVESVKKVHIFKK